ncbi:MULTISPECIES: DNA (cytosine-5-)-methyltransferase [unclassified Campylobacter]|uniref:DNA (cytosine-5-)-methyltransferase n=1 Tax=unclassified Campylobacter TaxID=2593542 RepID=UPI0022E9E34F|nr:MULTISPECIES: DNA (cytosine-5-)-methyltransferase [unclassified Campylobacter]MDA3079881.1 DNA (cytosine-5-)-methyltransferase [Campylobacter sp. CS_NA2]MDA3081359.1 DNA (cytosine-5-)-methyltransferase [Campylobacter sp. CS_NA1]MDA3085982.1 DNA (cytosine-5-)-methyltransferase [Campylobacter sp. CS_ED1]MDA3090715.1 DNA (cytosine-5-)-methyltransferase [Campylobacter sp. CS_ED2]WBR50512.1 DNA (cytosine-5-)-methyltransferase [Campylobacter sp. CS_NA3]
MCELFAGVGGFGLGFSRLQSGWQTVWFSQWEPNKTKQWAHECYVKHFGNFADENGEFHTNKDIAEVDKKTIPDHTLLVGGFPCQDYSVANSLPNSKGLEGQKGVLWWQIRDVIIAKKPPFCLFENVDRLLKSPARQRGRDFGVMLSTLHHLGYFVEWRVINAAIYGAAQRRRRVFIFAYKKDTKYANFVLNKKIENLFLKDSLMAKAFAINKFEKIEICELDKDIKKNSDEFKFNFESAGFMINNKIYTTKVTEKEEKPVNLEQILEKNVSEKYYLDDAKLEKMSYLKGSKKINRKSKNGHEYVFSEGPVAFPDPLDKPARTMLTSESTINRSTHVVCDPQTNRLRILTPIETERLQGFDDNWTDNMSDRMRYFCMGNALVVPMITRIGRELDTIIEKE